MAGPSGEARLIHFFPTQVVFESWPGAGDHGPALAEAVLKRRAGEERGAPARWRSDNSLLHWGGDSARALCDHIVGRIDAMTVDKGQQGTERRFRWGVEAWADILGRDGAVETRSHPGSSWTAICHIDAGDGAAGGELIFIDPRYPMVRMPVPELRIRRRDGEVDQHEVRMSARSGDLVLFPSWLAHAVRPYRGDRPRIAIGMTFRADWIA